MGFENDAKGRLDGALLWFLGEVLLPGGIPLYSKA